MAQFKVTPLTPTIGALIEGVEYAKVRDAIRATVNPKLHHSAGYSKTLEAYNVLTDEQKAAVGAELAK